MLPLLERFAAIPKVRAAAALDEAGTLTYAPTPAALERDSISLGSFVGVAARNEGDTAREDFLDGKMLARRVDGVWVAVVADADADDLTIQRQFNVIAIRMKASASVPPASTRSVPVAAPVTLLPVATVNAIEESLVSLVGPMGKMMLARARERAGIDAYSVSPEDARRMVREVAGGLPERAREPWTKASALAIDAALEARARIPSSPPASERRPTPPPPVPAAPTTDLRWGAIERALLQQVGPLGKMLVQTAKSQLDASGRASDIEAFVDALAQQVPAGDRRAAFIAAARAISTSEK